MPSFFNSCIKTKPPPTDLCLPLLHTTSIIKLRGRAFTSSMALLMARKNSAEAINSCRIWKCQPTCLLRERSMLGSVKCSSPTLTTGRPCELSSSPQRRPLLTITTLVLDCKASFRLFKASVFVEYCSPKGSMVVATKALRDRRWHLGIARPGLSPHARRASRSAKRKAPVRLRREIHFTSPKLFKTHWKWPATKMICYICHYPLMQIVR